MHFELQGHRFANNNQKMTVTNSMLRSKMMYSKLKIMQMMKITCKIAKTTKLLKRSTRKSGMKSMNPKKKPATPLTHSIIGRPGSVERVLIGDAIQINIMSRYHDIKQMHRLAMPQGLDQWMASKQRLIPLNRRKRERKNKRQHIHKRNRKRRRRRNQTHHRSPNRNLNRHRNSRNRNRR